MRSYPILTLPNFYNSCLILSMLPSKKDAALRHKRRLTSVMATVLFIIAQSHYCNYQLISQS